jgi:hypothetical protein
VPIAHELKYVYYWWVRVTTPIWAHKMCPGLMVCEMKDDLILAKLCTHLQRKKLNKIHHRTYIRHKATETLEILGLIKYATNCLDTIK